MGVIIQEGIEAPGERYILCAECDLMYLGHDVVSLMAFIWKHNGPHERKISG